MVADWADPTLTLSPDFSRDKGNPVPTNVKISPPFILPVDGVTLIKVIGITDVFKPDVLANP